MVSLHREGDNENFEAMLHALGDTLCFPRAALDTAHPAARRPGIDSRVFAPNSNSQPDNWFRNAMCAVDCPQLLLAPVQGVHPIPPASGRLRRPNLGDSIGELDGECAKLP